ncbi:MAG TPA: PadR family transcriptional regulator [Longimicrobiales bacterium]|nr:PadR family transcriptional regulator [Longimicrobiales bacterium]
MTRHDGGLPRSQFLILLALADAPRHGLGIAEDIDLRTGGAAQLGPGTLYGTLKRLSADGWIEESPSVPDPDDHDSRRRYWRLTPEGRAALAEEVGLLRDLLTAAEDKAVLAGGSEGS